MKTVHAAAIIAAAGITAAIIAPNSSAAIPAPHIVAHRGGTYDYPENTLPALLEAAARGYIAETDIRWTADNIPVLSHDPDTARVFNCPGGPKTIAETTWPVLRTCKTKPMLARNHRRRYNLADLATVIRDTARASRSSRIWPELKTDDTPDQDQRIISILRNTGMIGRTTITSFNGPRLARFTATALAAGAALPTLLYESGQGVWATTAKRYGVTAVGPSYFTLHTRGFVRRNHAQGLAVAAYDNDTPARWADATRLGVDYLITDHPNALADWAAK